MQLPSDRRMCHVCAALRRYTAECGDPDEALLARLYSDHIAATDMSYESLRRDSVFTRLVARAMDVYPIPEDGGSMSACIGMMRDLSKLLHYEPRLVLHDSDVDECALQEADAPKREAPEEELDTCFSCGRQVQHPHECDGYP
jgi:hypothetical protein